MPCSAQGSLQARAVARQRRARDVSSCRAPLAGPSLPVDVVFPVLHGPHGEDGTVQGLLELGRRPVCRLRRAGQQPGNGQDRVQAAAQQRRHSGDAVRPRASAAHGRRDPRGSSQRSRWRWVIPSSSSRRTWVPASASARRWTVAALCDALDEAARYDRRILVEQAVASPREIECAVLGNDNPIASVPGEVVPSNDFYDYAAKYIDGKSALRIPAPHRARGCRAGPRAGRAGVQGHRRRRAGPRGLLAVRTRPGSFT